MRVLVVAHRLELGGTQTNAIELSARLRDVHGHDVVLAATPGPAAALAAARGLDLHPLPDARRHPSPARARALAALARRSRPDVIHAWDWPQCFDAYGLHLRGLPLLCTCMGMVVPGDVPRLLPTTFGTADLADQARRSRRGPVHLLEPPVDVEANRPGAVEGGALRAAHGIGADEVAVVTVSRLEAWLKLEGLVRTVRAVGELAAELPVRLLVVGEGSARERLAREADAVNRRRGRTVVSLTGPLVDPRPAYAAADVMVGMGSSALRTMAFGVPLVVIGERGFSRVLDETSVPLFAAQGFYGVGDGTPDDLVSQLRDLVVDGGRRERLGALGRAVVLERYGLDPAAARLSALLAQVATTARPWAPTLLDASRSAARVAVRAVAGPAARRARDLATEVAARRPESPRRMA